MSRVVACIQKISDLRSRHVRQSDGCQCLTWRGWVNKQANGNTQKTVIGHFYRRITGSEAFWEHARTGQKRVGPKRYILSYLSTVRACLVTAEQDRRRDGRGWTVPLPAGGCRGRVASLPVDRGPLLI